MTKYAKFIDENTVRYAPRKLVTPHLVAFNFNENVALMRQEGYLPLVETNHQEDVEDETHYARPTYVLKEAHHTETVPETIVDENGEEHQGEKSVEVNDSYIEITYIAVDRPEESDD